MFPRFARTSNRLAKYQKASLTLSKSRSLNKPGFLFRNNIRRFSAEASSGGGGGSNMNMLLIGGGVALGAVGFFYYRSINQPTSGGGSAVAVAVATMPEIRSKHSLVAKYLTPEIYNKYKDHKTANSGCTLDACIACAVAFDNQHVGIYAGDYDSYIDYNELMDPVIKEYHNFDGKHKSNMNPRDITRELNDNVTVKSTRIRVGRNIEGYGLSPGILKADRLAVEKLVKGAFTALKGDLSGTYYSLGALSAAEKQSLVDDHFLFVSGDPNLIEAGMERDWPEARGIFVSKNKKFLVWVNEEDQLRIISMQQGGDVKNVFTRLTRGINQIENYLAEQGKKYQFTERLGYIHSCPTNLGTGMRASVHMELGSLKKKFGGSEKLKAHCKAMKLQARGTRGESGGDTGSVYDISNRHRLGYTEVELVQTMIDGVNALYEQNAEAKQEGY